MIRFLAVFVACVALWLLHPTASARAVDNLEQWSTVSLDAQVAPKLRLYAEGQPRLGDNIREADRLIVRGALGYQATKHLSIWQGYAWAPVFKGLDVAENRFTGEFTNEHRIYQQLLAENSIKKLAITNRMRLEERFISNSGEVALRARHMLRLTYPIPKTKHWRLVGYDELFVNLNDTPRGPQAGFDQNRAFLGVNRTLGPNANLEMGYLLNHVNTFNSPINRTNHIIMVGLSFRY